MLFSQQNKNKSIQNLQKMTQKFTNYITLILALSCLLSCSSDDNITDGNTKFLKILDASFEAILISLEIDSDGVINQQMLRSDAEMITELDLSTFNHGLINNLSGIEGFINLKKLNVNQHNIDQLDLSSNILLDVVYLAGNNLSHIDLNKNINLEVIDLSANELTEVIGISRLLKLKELDLSFNFLEEFTVSNTSLEILHLSNNDLTSINIKEAVNIVNLLLTTNKINSLDVASNQKLRTLLLSDNLLQSINLSKNNNLTHLYITSNHLNSLDVSNNLSIIDLKVDRNPNLRCIKVANGQDIQSKSLSNYQELNAFCD